MLQAHGKTKFEQQLIFTIFSNWLEAYLIVALAILGIAILITGLVRTW